MMRFNREEMLLMMLYSPGSRTGLITELLKVRTCLTPGERRLTAKCRFFFKQNNLMTFYTCNSRCFHTCNSTADHNYFFLLIGRSDRSLILISVFRIEYAA